MWHQVSIVADAGQADSLSDAFSACGALAVTIEDADAGTDRECAQFGEPGFPAQALWPRSRVLALFEADCDVSVIVADCLRAVAMDPGTPVQSSMVAEHDWVRLSQAEFAPMRINSGLWIVPSWHEPPDPAAINIRLDPGLAFGTGSHATTRLCLDWLTRTVLPGSSVLDYGCGSGILAIAAAKLGGHPVVAVDIDEQAILATRANAALNAVAVECLPANATPAAKYDRVVANILTNPLCVLAPAICAHVAAGGQLALSGILQSQARLAQDAYAPHIALEVGAIDDGWVRLEGRRP